MNTYNIEVEGGKKPYSLPLKVIASGERITISNFSNDVPIYINPYGNINSGIPTEEDRNAAYYIKQAVNEHDSLIEQNKCLLEALKEMLPLFVHRIAEWVLPQEPTGDFIQSEFEDKNECYAAIIHAKEALKKANETI